MGDCRDRGVALILGSLCTLSVEATARIMHLTPELVALVERIVEDEGYPAGTTVFSEQDYDEHLEAFLDDAPSDGIDVFAYGSLIWNPCFEHTSVRRAVTHGLRRQFCMRITRFRGNRAQPGRMMALDDGGECHGLLYRLTEGSEREALAKLWRREITRKPATNMPVWIDVESAEGRRRAIAFRANSRSDIYAPEVSPEETAEILSKAVGHWGSGALYLRKTVQALEAAGIHDPHLWRLQELVAAKIASRFGLTPR